MQATDEGTIPMKTHRYMPRHALQPSAVPAQAIQDALRSKPLSPAGRGILALAFALGSLGAVAAASGYGSAGAHASAGSIRLAASADPAGAGHSTPISNAWIY